MPEPRFVTSFEEFDRAEGQGEERRVLVLRLNSRRHGPCNATPVAALALAALGQLSEALHDVTDQADLFFMRSLGAKRYRLAPSAHQRRCGVTRRRAGP